MFPADCAAKVLKKINSVAMEEPVLVPRFMRQSEESRLRHQERANVYLAQGEFKRFSVLVLHGRSYEAWTDQWTRVARLMVWRPLSGYCI